MYEGVHMLHHAKDRYGTDDDPEYRPLARLPARQLAVFLGIAALAPLGVFLRFAVITPLSLLIPPLRRVAISRLSAMTINPSFVRQDLDRARRPGWLAQRSPAGCGAGPWWGLPWPVWSRRGSWSSRPASMRAMGGHEPAPHRGGAHVGERRRAHELPRPVPRHGERSAAALLPVLWAPVGLRYHALHHLMPRLPYHNLAPAHRRLVAALPPDSDYRRVEQTGLVPAVARLARRMRSGELNAA